MTTKQTDCTALNKELVEKIRALMPDKVLLSAVSEFFKIMGDSTRIRLLRALDESEMCLCDLSVLLNMTKSALSHQLKTLKEARLVKSRRNGKHVYYSLDDEHIKVSDEMINIIVGVETPTYQL